MTFRIVHPFESAVLDSADADLIQPSHWNQDHTATMATSRILGRVTADTGAVEELTATQVVNLISSLLVTSAADLIDGTTGTGQVVLETSPTISGATLSSPILTTPTLGVAAATKLTITPAAEVEALIVSGFSLSGSDASSIIDLSGTWNTSGVPSAIKLNITNTASGSDSNLIDLRVGNDPKFKVDKDGRVYGKGSNGNLWYIEADSGGAGNGLVLTSVTTGLIALYTVGSRVSSTMSRSWGSAGINSTGDVFLYRDAAAILALRNDNNQQALRVYGTWTNSTNYERAALNTDPNFMELACETAGTGNDNLDLKLTPAGTGLVRFGTFTATGGESYAGYITVKDAAGNSRKVAVFA